MSYPERQPIYKTYEKLVEEIVKNKQSKSYALGEINALEADLLVTFEMIKTRILLTKEWPKEDWQDQS